MAITLCKEKTYNVASSHAVNLRPRMDPALSNHHFGNILLMVCTTPAPYSPQDDENLVNQVRQTIKSVNAEFVKDLQGSDSENLEIYKDVLARTVAGEVEFFVFTSLSGYPTNNVDFGWGKPVWVLVLPLPFKNMVTFLQSQNGDGIEAWINLKEEDMAEFQSDPELLSYVKA